MAQRKNPGDGSPPDENEGVAPPKETKSDRFRRLAKARMPVVIYRLRQIKLLGGPTYEFTADEAAKIVATLRQEVAAIEEALKPNTKNESGKPAFDF